MLAVLMLGSALLAQEQGQKGRGLHGYIGYRAPRPPAEGAYGAGVGFYAAVWTLVEQPLAGFQIGLPSNWILPDNSDNKDRALAPEGTLARRWKERGPTWASVFQTLEGGLGYWTRSRFRYGPPKFSMNSTPQCYDYEVASPGWSFFYDSEALPADRLGVAQLSNRLLIPPDGLPFAEGEEGRWLGYSYMALPFTDPVEGPPPTGEQSWTCFLEAKNFKGPIAYYVPETWSKIAALFDEPFLYGRGLDTRPGICRGGAMEVNTVPCFEAKDAQGVLYSKIPELRFPVDAEGQAFLVQDVRHYSRRALFDAVQAWRRGGQPASGSFDLAGAWLAPLSPNPLRFKQSEEPIRGVEEVFETRRFGEHGWGLGWKKNAISRPGRFPTYFRREGKGRVPVAEAEVPKETGLHQRRFRLARRGAPFTSPPGGAWAKRARGPFRVTLRDGSTVTYSWYRFVDQPVFHQHAWAKEKKERLQAFVAAMHRAWKIDGRYMPPPGTGELASLDPALIVTPPAGMEHGYVPIVTRQEFLPR